LEGGEKMLLNLEAERVRRNMSRHDVAGLLGISYKTYVKYINEESSIPSKLLVKLSDAFDCTVDYLLSLSERKDAI